MGSAETAEAGGVIRAIVFDKDGTLFDFRATWSAATTRMIAELVGPDAELQARLERAIGFDMGTATFDPASVVIAGTLDELAVRVIEALDGTVEWTEVIAALERISAETVQVEAVPLRSFVEDMQGRGYLLGVVTNDGIAPARAHLDRAGVLDCFAFVAGYDSGFGQKPAPGPLLAFAETTGVPPGATLMVGDSTHDLIAGRAAGMATAAVLTGIAGTEVLAPHADVVLADIGEIPGWLDRS